MTVDVQDILNQLYGLRTHPFAPEVGADGQPIDRAVLSRTLDPYKNERELAYFYDFYEWHNQDVMANIDRNHGFRHFTPQEGDDPLVILISGYNKTGRRSLARLVRKQIGASHGGDVPIIVEVDLVGKDANVHARELATAFIDSYVFDSGEANPTEERLQGILDRALNTEQAMPGTGYQTIFQSLKRNVRRYCSRPTVFEIRGIHSQDSWRKLYKILSPLANYLVIITTDEPEASVGRNSLRRKGIKLASVTAPRLNAAQAKKFLLFRIKAERLAGHADPSSLQPFDASAIDGLFASGVANRGAPVEWQIQWIIAKLSFVLDRHLQALKKDAEDLGDIITDIPQELRLIDEIAIHKYLSFEKEIVRERSKQ